MDGYTWNDLKELVKRIPVDVEMIKASNLVLFGAGMNGSSAYRALKNDYSVYAFTDNAPQYRSGECNHYEGLEVIAPEKLNRIERVFVLITVTGHHDQAVKKQLKDLGVPHLTYFEFLIKENFEKFGTVYHELLKDTFSKKTYLYLLMSHLTYDTEHLKEIFVRNQYFDVPEFYAISAKDIFVDCGAYVGDSMERFIENRAGVFKTVYCFEPTEKTYKALCLRRERLLTEWALSGEQIIAEKKLISARNEKRCFFSDSKEETANRVVNEEKTIGERMEAVSLDTYFETREKPTFIKADVEGAEMDLILGAEGIIREHTPLLAICIYHTASDLYEIPLKIKALNPGYRMEVRHHMPNFHETVLYCY